jgi:ketosteroid isomerase-like protein
LCTVSANLDLVRAIYAAWERGDYRAGDWQHPEIQFVMADGPTPGSWTGAAGITEGWGSFLSAWEGFHHRADEYRELDGERVLVLARFGGRGKGSGLEIGEIGPKGAVLFQLHAGKVRRIVLYFDRQHALADLALESGSPGS